MHIHVGHNILGDIPEGDIMCFDSADDALESLRHELRDQQGEYYERCEATSPEQQEKGSECCDWCDVAGDVEASLSFIADGDKVYGLNNGQGLLFIYSPPEGADIAHWIGFGEGDREACEIAQEQEE